MNWEVLSRFSFAVVRRCGRFVAVDLTTPHRTISTSARNGGQTEHVRHLINHQSCEGSGHAAVFEFILKRGEEAYHDAVCAQIGLAADNCAVMGTAANMNYATVVTRAYADIEASAVVTAGVQTNATCAGDPAAWCETNAGFGEATNGTINIILLLNAPLTMAALTRVVSLMTEAKSAALSRLAIPSCYSSDLATGTGTDQYCVAAPIEGRKPLTSASPHTNLGEIVGCAVRDATLEALRWQNGLEPSFTRGLFHALGRYGVTEQVIIDGVESQLDIADFELFKKNSKAVFYDPQVGAAAHALAAVIDRGRHGSLPQSGLRDAIVQQAALLAANLAARVENWTEYHRYLRSISGEPKDLVIAAIALGWKEKWRPT
jgi:adenosylcobinamide hydrolase